MLNRDILNKDVEGSPTVFFYIQFFSSDFTVGFCTVPCVRSFCHTLFFFQVTEKGSERLGLINLLLDVSV